MIEKYTYIINKYYASHTKAHQILLTHSIMVMNKAVAIAKKMNANIIFVREASFLHDIGIIFTNAPGINCYGDKHYLCHGCIGREILEKEGLPKHALVCERHTGVGLTMEEIITNKLPLPHREMIPLSLEEKIICYADNFFSKTTPEQEKSTKEIIRQLSKFGDNKVAIFKKWHSLFGE